MGDVGGRDEVDISEYLVTLIRFKGTARSVDMATLLYAFKRSEARFHAYMECIEVQFQRVEKRIDQCLGVETIEAAPETGVFAGHTMSTGSYGSHGSEDSS